MENDDFIVYNEDGKWFISSNFFSKPYLAKNFLGEVNTSRKIAKHVFDCDVCKNEGLKYCDTVQLIDGVYNDINFLI